MKTLTDVIHNLVCAGQSSVYSPDRRSFEWRFSCANADYRPTSFCICKCTYLVFALKKKKKNLLVKFNKNNNNNKTDTLTGCQGGYTPINAGRLW